MSQTIAILGRQPALGIAELESLYGADCLRPIGEYIVLVNKDPSEIDFNRLGGSIKLAKLLTPIETTDWPKIVKFIAKAMPEHLGYIPEGKIRLGLNVFDLHISPNDINRGGLIIKKAIKQAGRSVRVVPNSARELNSAQTLHNQLTGPTGIELVVVRDGNSVLLGQVSHVQDINAYTARDQARPKRDARVGMLPPKLAQNIINLAKPESQATVLDPFCGTGVVLQEAFRLGYDVIGTDLDPRMVEYSQANLTWFGQGHQGPWKLEVGDATNHTWSGFNTVACETYLGRPFSSEPEPRVLQEVMQDVDTIHRKFLRNLAKQTQPGFRACIAIPAWKTRNGFKHLRMLDSLEDLGYTRMSFVHVNDSDLVYHREGQIVGRELVVIVRK